MMGWIDFHAHVLPCDHGSDGADMSLRQLTRAQAAGVGRVVATPHFYAHRQSVSDFIEHRAQAHHAVNAACAGLDVPRLQLGAEVLLFEGLENLQSLERLCIEQTNVLLLEMPFSGVSERLIDCIYHLQARRSLQIVLAHIDRYDVKTVQSALETGATGQLNADAVCSFQKRRQCRKWVTQGAVSALGSDVHRDEKHYKNFEKAVKILGADAAHILQKSSALLQQKIPQQG